MEHVHKVLRKRCVIADSKSLVIGEIDKSRPLSGKLLCRVVFVILQIAAPENGVLTVLGQVVISARNICIPAQMDWRIETESLSIQPVSDRVVVGQRVLVENCQHGGTWAYVQRLKRFYTGGVEL